MGELWQSILNIISMFRWQDILDIAIVSFLIYKFVQFIKNSRTQLLVKGSIIIAMAYFMALLLKLNMLAFIVEIIITNGVLAIIIIFQPEIRSVLEKMGRSKLSISALLNFERQETDKTERLAMISAIVEAYRVLRDKKMGALIVVECDNALNEIIGTGKPVDARPSADLIANIFFNKAPLHDGAVVIRDNRICAAGCILPLTQNRLLGVEVGTRHRAAIGMSENSDAVVIVLSEENGLLSIARGGELRRFANIAEFTSALMRELMPEEEEKDNERGFKGFKQKGLRSISGKNSKKGD